MVIAMMQTRPLWEHRKGFFDALVISGTNPDYKHHPDRKLGFEMMQDYIPKSQLGIGKAAKDGDVEEMTDEELLKWAGEKTEEEAE